MTPQTTIKRPAMLTWFVAKIILIMFPLSMVLIALPQVVFGINSDIFIIICSVFVAYKMSDYYDQMTIEIVDYLREKKND